MAKAAIKTKAPAKEAVKLPKKGDQVKFKGYSDDIDDPMFEAGDILTVFSASLDKKSGDIKVVVFKAEKGVSDSDAEKDTIFMPDEAEVYSEEDAKAKSKAPAKAASKAKPKAVEDDEEEDLEEDLEEDEDLDGEETDEVEDDEDEIEEDEIEEDEEDEAPKSKSKGKSVAKPKAKAPARTKDEEDEEEIAHSASVKKILKKGDMLAAAKEIVENASRSYFNLGGVLAEIKRTAAYEDHNFKGKDAFEDYIRTELGLEYRKAMKLITIYKVFSKLGIDEARVMAIGWTKASAIASYMPKDASVEDFEAMLDEGDEMTREDLIDHIKTTYVNAGKSERIKRTVFKFSAFADQAEVVLAAIDSAKRSLGSEDANEALLHIIQEWASMADGVDIELKDAIKVIEQRFKVKLVEKQDSEKEKPMAKATSEKAAPKKAASKATVKAAAVKAKTPAKAPAKVKAPAKADTKSKASKPTKVVGKATAKTMKSKKAA